MTRDMYEKKLQEVNLLLEKGQYSKAEGVLSSLEVFKPIPLEWFVQSAKKCMMVGDYKGFRTYLQGKWWPNYCYDGIEDVLRVYEQQARKCSSERDYLRSRYTRNLVKFIGTSKEENMQEQLEKLGEEFYTTGSEKTVIEMERITYITSNVLYNVLIREYLVRYGDQKILKVIKWMDDLPNIGYLKEQIRKSGDSFLLVAEEGNVQRCKAMAKMLAMLDKQVYLLDVPQVLEKLPDAAEYLKVSMEQHSIDLHGIHWIPIYCVEDESGQKPDNRATVINALLNEDNVGSLLTIIGSGSIIDDLEMQDSLKKCFSRLDLSLGDIFESNFSFAWAGNYLNYIANIYNGNTLEWVNQSPVYKYSIVIPARNSADSLRHTLQTCLELNYPKEAYEIVISDNSTNNNDAVYNLCQEINDVRIKYYRTPRDLHLPKSFEFAFLQSQGEFVISLGSDDAILPWALTVLDCVRKNYPQEEIIQWERGFYAWPGFNGGQQHQFLLPRQYAKGQYKEYYKPSLVYMEEIMDDPKAMYMLPMLYINSGFKRSYLKTLLKKTGRLWDGICQDIYMGVVNIIINNRILNIKYPMTIAGMSVISEGAKSFKPNVDAVQTIRFRDESRQSSNVGGFSMSMTEKLIPQLRSDVSSLYNTLLRMVARGLLSEEYMWHKFDWEKMFLLSISQLNICDIEFDKMIHYARYTASWHGEEFLQWFDETIFNKVTTLRKIDVKETEIQTDKRTYKEGTDKNGGIVVDASRYGVSNIYESVNLLRQLSHL